MTSDVSAMYAPEQVLSTSRELQAMHAGIGPLLASHFTA